MKGEQKVPSGPRFRITHEDYRYDFSPKQWKILTKGAKTLKEIQSLNGLIRAGLVHKRNGAFIATKLGEEVVLAYNMRQQKQKAKQKRSN